MLNDRLALSKEAALAEIARDPQLSAMLTFWLGFNEGGRLPHPEAIDPVAFPAALLPNLAIFDVMDGRFRFRLVGTGVAAMLGRDLTGHFLDETVSPELMATVAERYGAVVTQRRPIYAYAEYSFPDRPSIRNRVMALPLSRDGSAVDRILVVFRPQSERLIREAVLGYATTPQEQPTRAFIVL